MTFSSYSLSVLPRPKPLETMAVLRRVAEAHRHLAELKGVTGIIPNEQILVDTPSLEEAKCISAIENIITTDDELYRCEYLTMAIATPEATEGHRYTEALKLGFGEVKKSGGVGMNMTLRVQTMLRTTRRVFGKCL